jgi:restriction system protein
MNESTMAIPDYQSIMLPLLKLLNDDQAHRTVDLINQVGDEFQLSNGERLERLPSGQPRLANRVGWARTYMARAGLMETVARGSVRITERGRAVLAEGPVRIDNRFLSRYPEFVAFRDRTPAVDVPADPITASSETPDETIERADRQLRAALADELLARIKSASPRFFERLVLDLLVAMGYGGTLQDAAQVVGQSGDGGIDGVIKEDKLGLDMIYIQAKRWEEPSGDRWCKALRAASTVSVRGKVSSSQLARSARTLGTTSIESKSASS